ASRSGLPVLYPRDVGDGRFQDLDRPPGHVAPATPAGTVGAEAQERSGRGNGPALPERAVGFPERGAQDHDSPALLEMEMPVVGSAAREAFDEPPLLPPLPRTDLEDGRLLAGDHRPMLEREALAGHAFRRAEDLLMDDFSVHRGCGASDRGGG